MGEVVKTFVSFSGTSSIVGIIPEPLLRVGKKNESDTDNKRLPLPEDLIKKQRLLHPSVAKLPVFRPPML